MFRACCSTSAFSYAFNDSLEHSRTPVVRETEGDPYSLDDAFSSNFQVNATNAFGQGPKAYDIYGNLHYGITASYGVVGFDYEIGQNLFTPNLSLSCPYSLCAAGVGASYKNYQFTVTGAVRILSVEGAHNSSVNLGRLYERVDSSIWRLYGVPRN